MSLNINLQLFSIFTQ